MYNKLNLLFLSQQTHLNCIGGVSTHLELTSRLLIQMGHAVSVICPSGPGGPDYYNEIHQNGVRFLCVPGMDTIGINRKWIDGSRKLLLQELRNQNIDYIFSEGTAIIGALAEILQRHIPCFCFLHNFAVTQFYNISKEITSLRSLLYYFCISVPKMLIGILKYELPVYQKCTKVLSVSHHNAQRIKKYYRIKSNRLTAFYNWIDTSRFYPSDNLKADGQNKWNISQNHINFLLAGSLYLPKGFHIAIKAFGDYLPESKRAVLWIAGSGREGHKQYLIQVASQKNLKVGRDITFLGEINHTDLPMLYNSVDIFIMPSLLIEGSAYVLLEAMACGLPCIASNIGGNSETLNDAGMLYSPQDHQTLSEMMLELSKDYSKREYYGQKARQRVLDRFSVKTALKKLKLLMGIKDGTE